MADLIRHRQEWMFYVELDDGEAPDQKKEFTETMFRPSGFYFTLTAREDETPHLSSATIAGPKILKSGEPGATTGSERYYGVDKLPAWALAYYHKAIQEVEGGH